MLPDRARGRVSLSTQEMLQITPLIRERIKLLRDVLTAADFFFVDQLPPYDPAELIPQKGDAAMAQKFWRKAQAVLAERRVQTRSAWIKLYARPPRNSASRPDRCFSRFASPFAAARMRRRCLKRWKCWERNDTARIEQALKKLA